MNGYIVKITFNPDWTAYSYHLFMNEVEARQYADNQLAREEKQLGKKGFVKVEPCEVSVCSCGRLFSPDECGECLLCEELRADAEYDDACECEECDNDADD